MTWEWYFPPEVRARFEAQADLFETMTLEEWEKRWWEKKEDLSDALAKLKDWSGETDSALLISAWDDELIFWYVMKMQSVVMLLAANPTGMVPFGLEPFWDSYVSHLTSWAEFVFGPGGAFIKLAKRPRIWRIAWPAEQGVPPEPLTGDPWNG